ncbi:MAG TPA: hypothetical protein VGV35_16265, partial [Bryobacteraceae bacterium]|nr:hypothetical protein [Bryobacteraceae bacterium]
MPNKHLNGHSEPSDKDRAAINRANAQHSTGPSTPEGKQRSAMNALKHGLTARAILLPSEDPAAYQRHVQEFFDGCQPKGPIEKALVQSLADTAWRLNRLVTLEADLYSLPAPAADDVRTLETQTRALTSLSMHGHRLDRHFREIRRDLRELQKERRELEARQLAEAADLLQMDQEKGVAFD